MRFYAVLGRSSADPEQDIAKIRNLGNYTDLQRIIEAVR